MGSWRRGPRAEPTPLAFFSALPIMAIMGHLKSSAGRPVEFTVERKRLAVEAYRLTARATSAAEAAGVSLATLKRHRNSDPDFADLWDAAVQGHVEDIEEAVRDLALVGDLKATYDDEGNVITQQRKRSLGAMSLLLKGWAPEKYRENISLGVSGGTTVDVSHRIDPGSLTHEQRVAMRLLLRPARGVEVAIGEEVVESEE